MPRQDDPLLSGVVYRRIPPWASAVTWTNEGVPVPSSPNFRDEKTRELSVSLAADVTPKEALDGLESRGFGLVALSIDDFREVLGGVIVCRDEPPPGHVLICFDISVKRARILKKRARWVEGCWPQQLPPDAVPS